VDPLACFLVEFQVFLVKVELLLLPILHQHQFDFLHLMEVLQDLHLL
jgi:hypothetical protein